mgnify:FL=1
MNMQKDDSGKQGDIAIIFCQTANRKAQINFCAGGIQNTPITTTHC